LFGEADTTEHHCHDVSVAKHSAGSDETGKNSADDQIIADLDTLCRFDGVDFRTTDCYFPA
jgi:hypothetical protein